MKDLSRAEKISIAMKGRKLSKKHKENLSKAKLGKARSIATKAKIKETLLGSKLDEMKRKQPLLVCKTNMSRSHLTAENVKEIRIRYTTENGISIRKLAEEYNVSRHTIHSIVNNKTWKPKSIM
jgi:DNA invertase Pin-like site-specific DNA recombinase